MDLRTAILEADDRPVVKFDCRPGWDVTIWLRTITGRERDTFEGYINRCTEKKQPTTRQPSGRRH